MLEKIKDLVVKFFEHIGPKNYNINELNKHRELYIYMLAMLADEFLGCLVFVSYNEEFSVLKLDVCNTLFFIKDIVLISDNDIFTINLFDEDRWTINKVTLKELIKDTVCSNKLVRVTGTDETYQWHVENGLEGNNKKPSFLLFRKFDKMLQSFPQKL